MSKKLFENIGSKIKLLGRVSEIRDHGKLLFLDVVYHGHIVQVVAKGIDSDSVQKGSIVEVDGVLKARPESLINKNSAAGHVEVVADKIETISRTQPLPFDIEDESVDESIRMRYRYLDFRSSRMQRNLKERHNFNLFSRNYFSDNDFIEVETPLLTKGTPEGAREYVIPSRIHAGKYYVLPQSPQQYKQLLMVGDVRRYFQIARCMRDEDLRSDRQPEFTQLDIEMSYVNQEDVINFVENYVIEAVKTLFPKLNMNTPFPRITYTEAMSKYNSDKPDLRKDKTDPSELAFCWVVDFPLFEKNKEGQLSSVHHPFTMPKVEDVEKLEKEPLNVKSYAYDLVLNGFEIGGGSIRINKSELQKSIFKTLGLSDAEIQSKFGHMLEALSFAAPPHGGFAMGLDRIITLLLGEDSIRDVIAFPKTREGLDLLIEAPNEIAKSQKKELGIIGDKDKNKNFLKRFF